MSQYSNEVDDIFSKNIEEVITICKKIKKTVYKNNVNQLLNSNGKKKIESDMNILRDILRSMNIIAPSDNTLLYNEIVIPVACRYRK